MTSKIRKLYNVLVVGGAMAATTACTKAESKQPAPAPVVTAPAAADSVAAPTPAPVAA
nr:hypothetical protein [Deltaproteobacteria bacterium]